jgi:hypothetical protein
LFRARAAAPLPSARAGGTCRAGQARASSSGGACGMMFLQRVICPPPPAVVLLRSSAVRLPMQRASHARGCVRARWRRMTAPPLPWWPPRRRMRSGVRGLVRRRSECICLMHRAVQHCTPGALSSMCAHLEARLT